MLRKRVNYLQSFLQSTVLSVEITARNFEAHIGGTLQIFHIPKYTLLKRHA